MRSILKRALGCFGEVVGVAEEWNWVGNTYCYWDVWDLGQKRIPQLASAQRDCLDAALDYVFSLQSQTLSPRFGSSLACTFCRVFLVTDI